MSTNTGLTPLFFSMNVALAISLACTSSRPSPDRSWNISWLELPRERSLNPTQFRFANKSFDGDEPYRDATTPLRHLTPTANRAREASTRNRRAQYAPCMKRLRVLLERLRGVRRPPTGPLTTAEKTAAEELRQETLPKDNKRIERDQGERLPP